MIVASYWICCYVSKVQKKFRLHLRDKTIKAALFCDVAAYSDKEMKDGSDKFPRKLILSYYTILHYIALYYIILNYITYITLYCTILHHITLYYTILHYIILYYIILHYITLHYTTLLSRKQETSYSIIVTFAVLSPRQISW